MGLVIGAAVSALTVLATYAYTLTWVFSQQHERKFRVVFWLGFLGVTAMAAENIFEYFGRAHTLMQYVDTYYGYAVLVVFGVSLMAFFVPAAKGARVWLMLALMFFLMEMLGTYVW